MATFSVKVKEKHTDAKPFDMQVSGNEITTQAEAEAHTTKTSGDRLDVVATEAKE